jgi:hypothetical protein
MLNCPPLDTVKNRAYLSTGGSGAPLFFDERLQADARISNPVFVGGFGIIRRSATPVITKRASVRDCRSPQLMQGFLFDFRMEAQNG